MSCYHEEQFVQYVKGELKEEERTELEDHLYHCNDCLGLYMVALDGQEMYMPVMQDSTNFTNNVVNELRKYKKVESKHSSRKQLIHYTVAAGFTLMLMFSGVFDHLTNIVSEDAMNPTKSGSFSDKMMSRTVEMIEFLNQNEKERQ